MLGRPPLTAVSFAPFLPAMRVHLLDKFGQRATCVSFPVPYCPFAISNIDVAAVIVCFGRGAVIADVICQLWADSLVDVNGTVASKVVPVGSNVAATTEAGVSVFTSLGLGGKVPRFQ